VLVTGFDGRQAERAWQLVRGDELLAEIVVTGVDFGGSVPRPRPTAGFAEARQLFVDELRWGCPPPVKDG
jgi:hypothetical protein